MRTEAPAFRILPDLTLGTSSSGCLSVSFINPLLYNKLVSVFSWFGWAIFSSKLLNLRTRSWGPSIYEPTGQKYGRPRFVIGLWSVGQSCRIELLRDLMLTPGIRCQFPRIQLNCRKPSWCGRIGFCGKNPTQLWFLLFYYVSRLYSDGLPIAINSMKRKSRKSCWFLICSAFF